VVDEQRFLLLLILLGAFPIPALRSSVTPRHHQYRHHHTDPSHLSIFHSFINFICSCGSYCSSFFILQLI
jgi:hypothetical protein